MQPQTILFIGPQASGKGTQVERLMANLGGSVLLIQTGNIFRALAAEGGYTADRIKETINAGNLVPEFITNALVVGEFKDKLATDSTIILDGYPRNLAQVNLLEELLTFYGRPELSVVFLDTPDAVIRERMLGRGRADDTTDAIDERLRLYHKQTKPLLDYFNNRENTNFVTINGDQTMDEVATAIAAGLKLT